MASERSTATEYQDAGPAAAGTVAAGIVALVGPLAVVVAFLVYPLVWPIQPTASSTMEMPLVGSQDGYAAVRIPGAGDHAFRFLSMDLSMVFAPRQSLPVRLEIRGSSPDGPALMSMHKWNPDRDPKPFKLEFTYFTWFHSEAYLVFIQPVGTAQLRLNSVATTDYLKVLKTHRPTFFSVVLLVAALVVLLVVPGSLLFAVRHGRFASLFPEERRRSASYVVMAVVAVLSAAEAAHIIATVYLPAFSYCNGEWTTLDLFMATGVPDLVPFYNYAPGRSVSYALVINALMALGFGATDPVVTEIGYRVVQFAIALSANVVLFLYLIRMWKRLGLPGPYVFPLIPSAVLSLHPELVFTYLSAHVHTGLFFAIFIFLWVTSSRLVYEERSWRSVLWFGLACTAALLWRNELLIIPFAFLFLTVFAMGVDRRSLATAGAVLAITIALPLVVMTHHYVKHGQFVLHDRSQLSIGMATHIARGFPENSNGYLYDDCHVSSLALRTSTDMHVDTIEKYASARRLYADYVRAQPIEFARNVLYRMPTNIYDIPSNLASRCAKSQQRIAEAIKVDVENHIWLLLALNLGFLVFACLKGGREFVSISLPAVYGLYVVGTAGSGTGYFAYIFLTFTVVATVGIAAAFHYAAAAWSRALRIPPYRAAPPGGEEPMLLHQKALFHPAALASMLLLGFAAWQGLTHHSTARLSYTRGPERADHFTVAEMFKAGIDSPGVRIKWGAKTNNSLPYADGHLIEADGAVLVQTHIGGHFLFRLIDPATGAVRSKFTVPFVGGCLEGFFTKHGNYLYAERQDPAGKPFLERINLRDFNDRQSFDVKGWVYSPLLVDDDKVYYQAAGIRKFYVPVGVPLSRFDGAGADKGWRFTSVQSSSELAQNDCCLFFGSLEDGQFFAVNKDDGSEKWRFAGKANASIKPHVAGSSVIFVDAKGTIYELDAETGTLINEVALSGNFYADFAYADDVVYVGSMGGDLYAVDLPGRRILWKAAGHGAVLAKPLVRDGFLYFASGRWLTKLNAATGEAVWSMSLGHVIRDTPLVIDGRFLVRTNGYLFALEEE